MTAWSAPMVWTGAWAVVSLTAAAVAVRYAVRTRRDLHKLTRLLREATADPWSGEWEEPVRYER